MRIGILEAGHNAQALALRFGRFFDNFERWLRVHDEEFPLELKPYWVENGELPARIDECDGYIITGSAAAVYENHAWLAALHDFIHAAIDARIKLLGVCFGHQLIVDALGGRVEKSAKGWGIGRHSYALTKQLPWMDPPLPSFSLLACHQDQVVELSAGAQVLASREFCQYAMLAIGKRVLTVQAHPEFSADYAAGLYEHRRECFGDALTQRGLESLAEHTDGEAFARWALRFFIDDVVRQSAHDTSLRVHLNQVETVNE
jgi:GMP synthase-like glutamine amidotransferase